LKKPKHFYKYSSEQTTQITNKTSLNKFVKTFSKPGKSNDNNINNVTDDFDGSYEELDIAVRENGIVKSIGNHQRNTS
jgi:hypothetical protein